MKITFRILLFLAALSGPVMAEVSRYTKDETMIKFNGKSTHITVSSHIIVFEDANPDDYSLQQIAVPHNGELKKALITVTAKKSKPKIYQKKDAILMSWRESYELTSDAMYYQWDLEKIEPGSEIDCYFEIEDQDALGGKFMSVVNRLPVDSSIITISFPANKWRLKYSLDRKKPVYFDSVNNVTMTWHNLHSRDGYENTPQDFMPGLWYLFESKTNETDISEWQDVYLWAEKRFGDDLSFSEPSKMLAISSSPEQILSSIFKQCHYVAVELGKGWYVPTASDYVWSRGYGDCKGLATLFVNWMRAAGYNAWPVLVRASDDYYGNEDFPSPFLFNHMIAAYTSQSGDTVFQDITAEYCPLGYLPRQHYGCLAFPLVNNAHPVRLGVEPTAPDTISIQIPGEMTEDGTLVATIDIDIKGQPALLWNWKNTHSRNVDIGAAAKLLLESILPTVAIASVSVDSSRADVVHLSSDINIRRFCLKRDTLTTFKTWGFKFLHEDIKSDSESIWPMYLRRNITYKVAYRIRLYRPVYAVNKDGGSENDVFSYNVANSSHDDSLIIDFSLRDFPASLPPEAFEKYQENRNIMLRALENEVVLNPKKQ
jgi:hypothetical protein